jgi:SAM-dependent methyltransferase
LGCIVGIQIPAEKAGNNFFAMPTTSPTKSAETTKHWDDFAAEYENQVYSLTSFPEKVSRILQQLRNQTRILIVGCGSATYLQEAILKRFPENKITACDFSEGMLSESQAKFSHPNLTHRFGDTTNLGFTNEFDTVISTNSIIPPTRKVVGKMYDSIFRALKPEGEFVAYLPSFGAANDFAKENPAISESLDQDNARMWDTNDWQCFHTPGLIQMEFGDAGFREIQIQQVRAESRKEVEELVRLYGEGADKYFYLHFATAKKPNPKVIPLAPRQKQEKTPAGEIQSFTSTEITPKTVDLVARLYKQIFDNSGHYLVNTRTGETFSPTQIFGEKREFSWEELMDPPIKTDPKTGEPLAFFHDYETLLKRLGIKLKENAFLSLFENQGFHFANLTTVGKAFDEEGWSNRLFYSEQPEAGKVKCKNEFLEKINRAIWKKNKLLGVRPGFEFTPATPIFTFNAIGITKEGRGRRMGTPLFTSLVETIPPELLGDTLDIAECIVGSEATRYYKGDVVTVGGILSTKYQLEKGDHAITIGNPINYLTHDRMRLASNQ